MYDAAQSGVNASEAKLTPDSVKSGFGQIAACEIDGQAYAQPLVLAGVMISGQSHNVVYAATCHDSVYAFDADSGALLWHDSFLGDNVTTVPNNVTRSGDIEPEIGIVSTPVIDAKGGTLYVVAKTKETGRPDGKTHYVQKMHALDVATGAEKLSGPKVIADTSFDGDKYDNNLADNPQTPGASGTAKDAVDGKVYINGLRNNQRCSLTLLDGVVYVALVVARRQRALSRLDRRLRCGDTRAGAEPDFLRHAGWHQGRHLGRRRRSGGGQGRQSLHLHGECAESVQRQCAVGQHWRIVPQVQSQVGPDGQGRRLRLLRADRRAGAGQRGTAAWAPAACCFAM